MFPALPPAPAKVIHEIEAGIRSGCPSAVIVRGDAQRRHLADRRIRNRRKVQPTTYTLKRRAVHVPPLPHPPASKAPSTARSAITASFPPDEPEARLTTRTARDTLLPPTVVQAPPLLATPLREPHIAAACELYEPERALHGMAQVHLPVPGQSISSPRRVHIPLCSRETSELAGARSHPMLRACGCKLWPSSLVLLSYLGKTPAVVKGKAVVELGSGSGLCGITAWQLGARRVVLTDVNPSVLKLLKHNVALNQAQERLEGDELGLCVQKLDWRSRMDMKELRDAHPDVTIAGFDIVIASDCIYEDAAIAPLWHTVTQLLSHNNGAKMIIANELRYPSLSAAFVAAAPTYGFCCSVVDPADFLDSADLQKFPIKSVSPGSGDWAKIPLYVFERVR